MKKIALALLLIPSIAFAEVLIYFNVQPQVILSRLQNATARPALTGVAAEILSQAIIVATDNGTGVPVFAALIPDSLLAAARTRPQFLGKGLNEVKVNRPAVYNKIAQKQVRLLDNTVVQLDIADATPVGGMVLATDIPVQTYYGYDPMTGDAK